MTDTTTYWVTTGTSGTDSVAVAAPTIQIGLGAVQPIPVDPSTVKAYRIQDMPEEVVREFFGDDFVAPELCVVDVKSIFDLQEVRLEDLRSDLIEPEHTCLDFDELFAAPGGEDGGGAIPELSEDDHALHFALSKMR